MPLCMLFGDVIKSVEVDLSTLSSLNTRLTVRYLGMQVKGYYGSRITRYPNSVATFNLFRLITSGDISLNPGLDCTASCNGRKKPAWKFPCVVCEKPVRCNQKGILCDRCDKWFHIKCIDMDLVTYVALSSSQGQWFCGGNNCGLPFKFSNSFFESSTWSDFSWSAFTANDNSYDLRMSNNRLSSSTNNLPKCLLLNVRSNRNKIDESQAQALIALTETWLDVNFEDKELGLEGYNIFRKDRQGKRGGGVLMAIKGPVIWSRVPETTLPPSYPGRGNI